MVKNLKPASTNYKLHTTNYKEKGISHDGKSLRATSPFYNGKQPLSQLRCQLPYKGSLKPLLIGEVAHRAGEVAFCRPWNGTYDAACELRPLKMEGHAGADAVFVVASSGM